MKLCPHSAFLNFQLIGQISLLPSILTPVTFSPTYNLSLIVSLRLGCIRGIIDTARLYVSIVIKSNSESITLRMRF